MNDLNNLFNQAISCHQSGRIPEAINIYLRILPMQRENDELLFTIGTAYCQIGQLEEGLNYLRKSSRINPKNFHTFGNMGRLLTDLRRFDEAVINYNKALTLNPNFPEALLGRGNALVEMQRYQEAIQDYDKTLLLIPDFPLAYCNKGKALFEIRQLDHALICYGKAVELAPDFSEAYSNRGNVYKEIGDYERALADYDKAIELNPNLEGAYSNRGCVLEKLKKYHEALADHNRAIALKPDYAEAYSNRGIVLQELKQLDEALADHNRAIALKPDYAEAYSNRGNTLKELHRFDEALADYNKAIELKPDYAEAYSNRGNTLKELHRFDEALADYNKAIELKPDFAEAYWNKSLLLILTGQYAEGWKLYEWRFETKEQKQNHYMLPQHKWRGHDDAKFKKLLIYTEQGLGDFIQFCRYLPLVKQLGVDLIAEVPSALITLVSTLKCEMTVIAKGDQLPKFDAYCPIMSLPYAFETIVETIPAQVPYLFADKAKVNKWQAKLGQTNLLRIGLAWSGSTIHKNDNNRSIQLEILEKLLDMPIEWHSLQKEYREYDVEKLAKHTEIHQHQDDLYDFSDTAALIECMDLVISVDTSVAHVAGAIGKTVWILLPYAPDYRWFLDRDDSPWYPTAKLFRQPNIDDWQSVIQSVRVDLNALCKK